MRHKVWLSIAALSLAWGLPTGVEAQQKPEGKVEAYERSAPPPPGWKPCPRCQNTNDRREMRQKYDVDKAKFDPHDLGGPWGFHGYQFDWKAFPGLTPEGEKRQAATKGSKGINDKDPMLVCDPLGQPRLATYNYGTQFVTLPDRVLQFFEWGHTWRDIWTDGRKLPDDPPTQRWLGWNVGHWEGSTFVVQSTGFDDRSWIDQDKRIVNGRGGNAGGGTRFPDGQLYGMPHSDQLRVEERFTRTSYGTMDVTITMTDPVMFKGPWTTKEKMILSAGTELWEYFCVPSEEAEYNGKIFFAGAGLASPQKK